MADPAVLKQIKIKTGVLSRLVKEHFSYRKEFDKENQKLEKMRAEATTEDELYNVKKAEEVILETRGMIGDTARRCAAAVADLTTILSENSTLDEETKEFIDAKTALENAATVTSN